MKKIFTLLLITLMSINITTKTISAETDFDLLKSAINDPTSAVSNDVYDISPGYKTYQIKLKKDINASETLTINSGISITLNLNGFSLFAPTSGSGDFITIEASLDPTTTPSGALTIEDNSEAKNGTINGSGLYRGIINNGTFNIKGGKITNCITSTNGAAIYNTGYMSITNAEISSNTTTANGGAIYNKGKFETIFSANIKMENNIAANGGAIYNESECYIGSGYPTILIKDCNASANGGAIYNTGNNAFVGIASSKIEGCVAKNGGAIYNELGARSEIVGVTIEGCKAEGDANSSGGAIYNAAFVQSYNHNNVTIDNGTTIKTCSALKKGAGIYNGDVLGVSTCEISGNNITDTTGLGGGIYNEGNIFVGGIAIIKNNKINSSDLNNVYLADYIENENELSYKIIIGDATTVKSPQSGMEIGISKQTPGEFTKNTSTGISDYFTSDNSNYQIFYNANKILEIGISHEITFNTNDGSSIDNQKVIDGGKVIQPENPAKEGYDFVGWYNEVDCITPFDFNTPVTTDLVLFAKWKAPVIPNNTNRFIAPKTGVQ